MTFQIGVPHEVEKFHAAHASFFEGSEVLEEALAVAFHRTTTLDSPIDMLIFFLGHRCAQDFREIALLAANGFGWGATAHLRGMFERLVTMTYLHENPSEADNFIDYDFVRRWRVAQAIERTLGLTPEDQKGKDQLRENFDRVKAKFEIPCCKDCKEKRLNHTWSRLDVVSMAGKISLFTKLKDAVVPAYYMPLAQAHSTLASAILRVGEANGSFIVDPDLARGESHRSFQYAHLLLLSTLVIQHERFQLAEFDVLLQTAFEHFRKAWPSSADAA